MPRRGSLVAKNSAREAGVPARRPPVGSSCALCAREIALTFHHLIPRETHHRAWFRARYTKDQMHTHGIWICRACHDGLHDLYDELTLARRFSTLDALRADEAVMRHAGWVARQRRG